MAVEILKELILQECTNRRVSVTSRKYDKTRYKLPSFWRNRTGISGRDDGPAIAFKFTKVELGSEDGLSTSMTVFSKAEPTNGFLC